MLTDEQREALVTSIEHWKRNAAATNPAKVGVRASDCACCIAFRRDGECDGCPIAQAGHDHCLGTPYFDAADAYALWREWSEAAVSNDGGAKFRKLARDEVEFLESILDGTYEK